MAEIDRKAGRAAPLPELVLPARSRAPAITGRAIFGADLDPSKENPHTAADGDPDASTCRHAW
jgi:hypothetical protein